MINRTRARLPEHDVSIRVRVTTFGYLFSVGIACHGAGKSVSIASAPTPRLPPIRPDWCVARNERVDSAFAVAHAQQALEDSLVPLKPDSVRTVGMQSLLDGLPMFEGFLVTLVPTRPMLGGGGLVWVDGETGCVIVLRRYE